jgi:D-alanyl-D-alanine carboxypeptidase/D-alanyl-D-alanine-endopeptidase (penicillin-binding protein 4)
VKGVVGVCALVGVLAFAGAASAQSGSASLVRALARALVVPQVSRASTGAVAIDLRTGRVLYALNPDLPLVPASNEKLTVSYAALVRLGPSFRFRTDVLGIGHRDGATWRGNLYLRGGGDPTLTTYGLRSLALEIRRAGIRRVTGDVLADESRFDTKRTAPGWKRSFYLYESAPLSALVVNQAQFNGRMSPDPAGAAAAIFVQVLDANGVHVRGRSAWGTAPARAELLAAADSQPLADILRYMDRQSDNFTAEMLLKTLGHGSTAAGAAAVVQTLRKAHVRLRGVRIADGSGLSPLDRLTARAIAGILEAAWKDSHVRPVLWDALSVAGTSGTLAHRLSGRQTRGRIHAKTGTTDIASALSGYAGDRYLFAVVQDGHPVSTWWAHLAQDRFATALAAA